MSWIWPTGHPLLNSDHNDHTATECQGLEIHQYHIYHQWHRDLIAIYLQNLILDSAS